MKKRKSRAKLYGRGVSRPYVNKRNRLMLGSGKRKKIGKQRGGFLPALLTAVAPTALELISKIVKWKKEEIE